MKPKTPRNGTWAALLLASVVLLLSLSGFFDGLNRSFLDWSLRCQAPRLKPPEEAILILIDEPSVAFMSEQYHQRWPWSRDAFAGLFLALHQAGAERIVVDLMFLEHSDQAESDDLLGSYAAAIDGLVLAAPLGSMPVFWPRDFVSPDGEGGMLKRVGHVDYRSDGDGVIRHYLWPDSLVERASAFQSSSESLLLRWYGGLKDLPRHQVLSARSFLEAGYGPGGLLQKVHQSKVDEYDPVSLRKALADLPLPAGDRLKGKTVFVGTNVAGTYDVKSVPVGGREPGVLVHFTAWCNALQNAFIPEWRPGSRFSIGACIAFVLALVVTGWGWSRPDVKVLSWLTLLGTVCFFSASYVLLPFFFFPPAAPMGSLWMVFSLLTTRHWVEESRRKREVQALFGSYVSPSVVKRLVEHPESLRLAGEKKELSVYFSDLAGFTDMSETMEPEELVDLVNVYLSEMSEFILQEQGYLDKYIGDAIMGVFGAPEPLENHARSACRAALRSREHLVELNQRLRVQHGKELHARIGINTGDMIVGNLGSGKKRNYTVVGDAVNLASRLEGANKEFGTTILLGQRTEELAREWIVTRPVELLRVKGKKQPVQTYELLALKSSVLGPELELSILFSRAYHSYQQRDFHNALIDFERAASIYPEDQLSCLYAERCRAFLREAPAEDWDGVFVMKRK